MNIDSSYMQDKAARPGTSFHYATRFLPVPQRAALTAFAVFCREVGAAANQVHDPAVAARKLAWWRDEVENAWAGQPSHPVMLALMPHTATHGIDRAHLCAVIDGWAANLQQNRYLDFAGLAHFCHRTAGTPAEVAARIFGHSHPATLAYAHRIGLAIQLTHIIRNVGDDARRGRIYLPIDELQQFEVKAGEILARQAPWGYSPRFTQLMRFQAERAQRTYAEGLALLPKADRRAQRPGLALAQIYRSLLREIEARNFQVLHQHIALTPLRKAWIAMRTHWRER
jgi:15-cis-phytoene synthase